MTHAEIGRRLDVLSDEISKLRSAFLALGQPPASPPANVTPGTVLCELCGRPFNRRCNRQRICRTCRTELQGGFGRKSHNRRMTIAAAKRERVSAVPAKGKPGVFVAKKSSSIFVRSIDPPLPNPGAEMFELPIDGFLTDGLTDGPPRRQGRPAKLRQSRAPSVRSADDSSWWTKPDADFAKEAERMKGRGPRTGSEDRIVGMKKRDFFG